MFRLIKQVFFALLSFSESFSKFKTFMSLKNQLCMTRPTLIDLNHDEYNQGLRYYPFMINLERCSGNCNSFDNPSGQICVPNKTRGCKFKCF